MGSFRRSAGREKRPGRRGSRGSFRNRFVVPKADVGTPCMLIEGEYPDPRPENMINGRPAVNPYFISKEHRKGTQGGRSVIMDLCSAGYDPNNPLPCVWCHEAQNGDTSIDNGKSPRNVFTLNLVHLVWYHLVPDVDNRTGKVRTDPQGKPYMVKAECEGPGCEHCRQGAPKLFGAKKFLGVGVNHLDNLKNLDVQVGRLCLSCKEGTVKTASFECAHCGAIIIDCLNVEYTDKEIDNFASEVLTCPECKVSDLAIETLECSHCQDPHRTSIFDTVMYLRKTGEKFDSALSLADPNPRGAGWCFLDEFILPAHEGDGTDKDPARDERPLITGWDMKETDIDVKMVPIWDPVIAKLTNPYDFSEMLGIGKPRTLVDQAKRLQVDNPYDNAAPTRQYGQGPGFRQ